MSKGRFGRKLSALAATSALAAGFWLAAARPARAQSQPRTDSASVETAATAGRSYWKHPEYDAVLELWNCAERGICLRIHSLNPDDPKIRALAAKDAKKEVRDLTGEDLDRLCGYEFHLHGMKEKKDGKWQGKLYVKSRDQNFGVEIIPPAPGGDGKLRMRGWLIEGFWHKLALGNPGGLLGRTIEFTPLPAPPPACRTAPKSPAP